MGYPRYTPHIQTWLGFTPGTLQPSRPEIGYPTIQTWVGVPPTFQTWDEVSPTIQTWNGYPLLPSRPAWGYPGYPPPSRPGQGVPQVPPPSRPEMGYPHHPDLGWGTPHHADLGWGTSQHADLGWGTLPTQTWDGVPPTNGEQTEIPKYKYYLPLYYVRGR